VPAAPLDQALVATAPALDSDPPLSAAPDSGPAADLVSSGGEPRGAPPMTTTATSAADGEPTPGA
jgi:hypothetical protein